MKDSIVLKDQEIKKMVRWLLSLQKSDGGFCDSPDGCSTISCTYYVIRTILKLDSLDLIDKDKVISFLLSLKGKNHGFANKKGGKPDPQNTSYAIYLLKAFDSLDRIDTAEVAAWLDSRKDKSERSLGSDNRHFCIKDFYYTIRSLNLLDAAVDIKKELLLRYFHSLKNDKGSFVDKTGRFSDSLMAKHIVFLLEEIHAIKNH